ncbi:ABC transporter permease [Acidihalobacter yilgarnensis]|uniref:ABC transporter permease n=1 Tax=Acidihalobacter yilgarnensis TaxID=2819280 RepID=UPI002AC88FC4|nr:FtsX-like permease family protein [Acidihalobacter yilgarnensis]
MAVAAASFARRESDQSALMRCLGASGSMVLRLAIWRLLVVGLFGSLLGLALGALAQWGLSALLAGWFATRLPLPGWGPFGVGLISGLVLLLGFGLVPVLQVGRVPPLRVLRRELSSMPASAWLTATAALAAMGGLLRWQTGDSQLSLWVIGGGLVTVVVLWTVARGLMLGLARWHPGGTRFGWRFGLRNLGRRGPLGAVQLAAVGLGLSTLLLLAFVRGDLLDAWRRSLPADTPNQFAINIQTAQRDGVRALFAAHGLPAPDFYPMVRGRLVSINGKPVRARDYADGQARRLVRREFNLSWASHLQKGNQLVAGHWWASETPRGFSVDQGIARTLGIHLGDRLGFETAGQAFSGKVESLRNVRWDSFRPNFFVVAVPGMLDGLPVNWITSFYLPPGHAAFLPALVRAYPGVTLFDVDRLLAQVRSIIERGVRAVEYVFAFSLVAGLIVLYAAIDAAQAARRRELAVLRTLGASRRQLRLALAAEFAALGILAGVIASASASLLGYVLAVHIFNLDYSPDPRLWLVGVASGTLLVLAVGLWGTRAAVRVPPLVVLQSPD